MRTFSIAKVLAGGVDRVRAGIHNELERREHDDHEDDVSRRAVPGKAPLVALLAFGDGLDVGAERVGDVVGLDDQTARFDDFALDLAQFVVHLVHRARSMAWPMLGPLILGCSGLSCVAERSSSGGAGGLRGGERTGCTAEALEQCASQFVDGVDVFDGQGAIDWPAVADGGVDFAMIKATQGTDDTQSTFAANWSGARDAGVRRGAYHFFDPTDDGTAQARRFLAAVGPLAPGDLPPMLDIECPDGDSDCLGTGASGSAPAAAIAQRIWDWIHEVEAATATKPIVYTFVSYFESNGIDAGGLDAYPLFHAEPARTPPASAACFTVPAPWSRATLWQYSWSGRVPGIGPAVDLDRFLGSSADLQTLAIGPLVGAGGPERPGQGQADAGSLDAGASAAQPADSEPSLLGRLASRANMAKAAHRRVAWLLLRPATC